MKKFWGICNNDNYSVGCNGASVYVYDKNGKELKVFKDAPYTYRAKFKPNNNILVAKSTAGFLLIYDLENSNKTTPNTKTVPLSAESGRGAAPRPLRLLKKAGENFFLFFCCLSFLTD